MNRREALLGVIAVSATALSEDATDANGHFLDSISSEDIERILREIDFNLWKKFRNKIMALKLREKKRAKQEARGKNIILWRGLVTDDSLIRILGHDENAILQHDHHGTNARRREVESYHVIEPCNWQGIDIPVNTKVLLDARCLPFGVWEDKPFGGEILQTPKGIRVHIWPKTRPVI